MSTIQRRVTVAEGHQKDRENPALCNRVPKEELA
jgi:hypothetical protein